jgi:hypothetical protein
MEILISILVVVIGVMGYIIWNLLRKNEKAVDILVSYQNYLNELDDVITFIDERIQEIDVKGTFKSDDEIGFFFDRIKLLNNILNKFKVKL